VIRDRPWDSPDYQNWTEDVFKTLFPHDIYETDPLHNPKKGKLIWEKPFDSGENKAIELKGFKRWEEGLYLLELETYDEFGQVVTDRQIFTLFDPNSKKVADKQLFVIDLDKVSYQAGDQVKLRIGSAADEVFATIQVETRQGIRSAEMVQLNNETKALSFPLLGNDSGGFAIHYHLAFANSFLNGTVQIPVSRAEEKIEIETRTFRDKILPGGEETWSFKIKGANKEEIAAEILVGMYDASLDLFKPHSWTFNPLSQSRFYPKLNTNQYSAFGVRNFHSISRRYYREISDPVLKFPKFNWYGFSLNQNYSVYRLYMDQIGIKHFKSKVSDRQDDALEEGYVQGYIYESTGEPIMGVSIRVNGTSLGTLSDRTGFYSIKADKGDELRISFVGMQSLRKVVDDKNIVNFFMIPHYEDLNEVVVTGYGEVARKSITASSTADVEDLEEIIDVPITEQPALPEGDIFLLQARTNFSETAFFYPNLQTDKEGNFSFTFTAPEALTTWKLQLLAHTKDLKSVTNSLTTISQKELMVIPNVPRFLRQGDQLVLSAKIVNTGAKSLKGTIGLELRDAIGDKLLETIVVGQNVQKPFEVEANGSALVSWSLDIPKELQAYSTKS